MTGALLPSIHFFFILALVGFSAEVLHIEGLATCSGKPR